MAFIKWIVLFIKWFRTEDPCCPEHHVEHQSNDKLLDQLLRQFLGGR